MAERVNPRDIRIVPCFGPPRPALVLWVDDKARSCLVAAITRSSIITPRYPLKPSLLHNVRGSVGSWVSRVPLDHIEYRPSVGTMPADEFDAVMAWLKAEIDL